VWITSSLSTALTPTLVALGNFDGLHLGHRQVVQPILHKDLARQGSIRDKRIIQNPSCQELAARSPGNEGESGDRESAGGSREGGDRAYPSVVTFNPHPQEFFSGQRRILLTPPNEKVKQLEAMGVEQLVLLPFDRELAQMTPEEFVEEILIERLQAKRIAVGEDFRFGRHRSGTVRDLEAIAAPHGIDVFIVPLQTAENERISSSAIRTCLQNGNVQRANRLLGRPYSLVGTVVHGRQLGRTLGFPTANVQVPPQKFLPQYGVYAVRASWECDNGGPLPLPGVTNIGCRPTVEGNLEVSVEVHLFDYCADLYGKTLTVELVGFVRPEQKFGSLDALKAQIQADCDSARQILENADR
jgi:riboflavin kinase/FMN adenylyltransferase